MAWLSLDAKLARAGFDLVERAVVPRSFHASYIAHRVASSHGSLGRLAERLTGVVDPRLRSGGWEMWCLR